MATHGFFVTTPIYYISGDPHIGHAYTSIAADVLARYHRTLGPTFFLTGTDEHGQKVEQAAREHGLGPQAWTDELVPRWKALDAAYDVGYDDFIRTTEERHKSQVVAVFERLKETGDVYLGKYEGWYCTNDETFWLEAKLVDGHCPNPECGRAVQWLSEDNWFFALSKYRDRLLTYYRDNPRWVRPERAYNEMVATIEGGLDDLCISRVNLDWGVPLPGGGVMYVWLDALLNYITALDYASDGERFRTFWPADVQLIGKEIARFHTIIWPAVLWALGLEAPALVFAHGWITLEGEKMSKSKGNAVDPFAIVERVRCRHDPVFLHARSALRQRLLVRRRQGAVASQRRSRERSRQSREAHARDALALSRGSRPERGRGGIAVRDAVRRPRSASGRPPRIARLSRRARRDLGTDHGA